MHTRRDTFIFGKENVYHMHGSFDHPEYYEIAFSFRDVKAEADALEEIAQRHMAAPPQRILEIGCGNAPHLPEWLARGYEYIGLDLNPSMLEYAKAKAQAHGGSAEFIQANLVDFHLQEPVDLAAVFLGSLYVTDNGELWSHFDAMARALKPGGLYVLDRCIDFTPTVDIVDAWEEERDGIAVHASLVCRNVNRACQLYEETLILDADDNGGKRHFEGKAIKRAIYPQEFLLFLRQRDDFEFIGWWNEWDLEQPLDTCGEITRPVAAIRRI